MTWCTWVEFSHPSRDCGGPVSRAQALQACAEQLIELVAVDPSISGATLVFGGERLVIDLKARPGRA